MQFVKLVLSIIAMTIAAGGAFAFTLYLGRARGIEWLEFPQAAAVGCLAAALIPLFLYLKSRQIRDRVLTIVQVIALVVTAAAGALIPRFLGKELLLFTLWFLMGAIGVSLAVKLTYRLSKNGERLTADEINDLKAHYANLVALETYFQDELQCFYDDRSHADSERLIALSEMLGRIRSERSAYEAHLRLHASIRPPPAFGTDIGPDNLQPSDNRMASAEISK